MRDILSITGSAFILTPCILAALSLASAQVMQSPNYRLQFDSVNMGGGLSTSSSYTLESTGGEIATGQSSSTNYVLGAGYQQMNEVFISLSAPSSVSLSPSIPGISGGTSNGSTTVTVLTDSVSGYALTIAASLSPALQKGGDSIADYVPGGANPDFSFTTDPTDAHFGFSPSSVDVAARYRDNGSTCGTGSGDVLLACWDGLSTTARTISTKTSANNPSGSTTTIYFRVGVGGSVVQPPGVYVATTTLTALPL